MVLPRVFLAHNIDTVSNRLGATQNSWMSSGGASGGSGLFQIQAGGTPSSSPKVSRALALAHALKSASPDSSICQWHRVVGLRLQLHHFCG